MREYLGYGVYAECIEQEGLIILANQHSSMEIRLDHPTAKALLEYLTKELEKIDV